MDEWKEWFWEERGRCGAVDATRRVIWPYLSLYAPPSPNLCRPPPQSQILAEHQLPTTVRYL